MSAIRARVGSTGGFLVLFLLLTTLFGRRSPESASADPGTPRPAATAPVGSYSRYTHRLEDEAVRILTPEIGGSTKKTLATHGLDLWGCLTIREWREAVLRFAPTADRALAVLINRTEVLFAEEEVDEAYTSTILQLGSVHAMQKGLDRVLAALGVTAPASAPAPTQNVGAPERIPTVRSTDAVAAPRAVCALPGVPPPAMGGTTNAYTISPRGPTPTGLAPAPAPAPTVAPAPARPIPPARSPYELAAYQGALARESYRVLYPEIENGAQVALAAKRTQMRNAPTVAAWKALLVETNPVFAKAAAVLERRTEVLRGETRVTDPIDSPHTQRAAVFGLQAGLEKILSLYGK